MKLFIQLCFDVSKLCTFISSFTLVNGEVSLHYSLSMQTHIFWHTIKLQSVVSVYCRHRRNVGIISANGTEEPCFFNAGYSYRSPYIYRQVTLDQNLMSDSGSIIFDNIRPNFEHFVFVSIFFLFFFIFLSLSFVMSACFF